MFTNPYNSDSNQNNVLGVPSLIPYGFNDVVTRVVVFNMSTPKKIDQNGEFKEGFNFGYGCREFGRTDFFCIINVILSIFCLIVAIWFMYERLSGKLVTRESNVRGGLKFNRSRW